MLLVTVVPLVTAEPLTTAELFALSTLLALFARFFSFNFLGQSHATFSDLFCCSF